jgi:hypothetical protein
VGPSWRAVVLWVSQVFDAGKDVRMTRGTIPIVFLVLALLGGFIGFAGGYRYGHGGVGLIGVVLIVVASLVLTGQL